MVKTRDIVNNKSNSIEGNVQLKTLCFIPVLKGK